jgi:hypothetical protein
MIHMIHTCARAIVRDGLNPCFLDASCCSDDVISGGGGFLLVLRDSASETENLGGPWGVYAPEPVSHAMYKRVGLIHKCSIKGWV